MWTSLRNYLPYLGIRLFRTLCLLIPSEWLKGALFILLKWSRYRRETIIGNLSASFPEKTAAELANVATSYYRHLVSVSIDQLSDYREHTVHFQNTMAIDKLLSMHSQLIVLGSHYGYWETAGKAITHHIPVDKQYVAYKKIRNPYVDKYLKQLRSDTVAIPIEQKSVYRQIVRDIAQNKSSAYYLIADQYPSSLQNIETLPFLHQETRWINSAKRIAHKHNLPIVYLQWNKNEGQDHYCEIVVIYDPSSADTDPLRQYANKLEQQIAVDPSKWLWSHKRWKNIR